jgi:MerR family redox-sensitive transcriptional activator SoxR
LIAPTESAELLTIGELAARSGVAPSALRYYERLGLIRATRTGGNQRRYERAELRRVAFIRVSAQVGISLDEIGDALRSLPDARTPTRADWAVLSRTWRHRLDEQIALLERLRDNLTGCIGCGCLSLQSCFLLNRGDRLAAFGPGPQRVLRSVES